MALSRAAFAAGLFLLVRVAYRRLRGRDGLGLGDVKLAGAAGAWLSLPMLPISLEIAAVAALAAYVFRQRKRARVLRAAGRVPFGAFFAPAIWLGWMMETMLAHLELGGFKREVGVSRRAGKDAFSGWMARHARRRVFGWSFFSCCRRPSSRPRARTPLPPARGLTPPISTCCRPRSSARLAEQGDARAQTYLGVMYLRGQGVPQNFDAAAFWLHLASETGLPEAQYFLGLMYDKGQGVAQDFVLAHAWLNVAVAHAEPRLRSRWVLIRNAVASKMTEWQLAEARRLAYTWRPETPLAFEWRPDPPR